MTKFKGNNKKLPRLIVRRSNKFIYADVIDSVSGKNLASASSMKFEKDTKSIKAAEKVGAEIAKKALAKKVKNIVFDRNKYRFHGRVKSLAESARKEGLKF